MSARDEAGLAAPASSARDGWWAAGTAMLARASFLPTLAYNVLMRRCAGRAWWSHIDQHVLLGALPFKHHAKQLVEEENVGAVVSMNEDYELKHLSLGQQDWRELGVDFLQLSTTDIFAAPCQHKLNAGVQFILRHSNNSVSDSPASCTNTVYVHCKAGRTRSATLVGCYLIKLHNWSVEEAVEYMRRQRPHILLGPKQWQAMREFRQNLVENSPPEGSVL